MADISGFPSVAPHPPQPGGGSGESHLPRRIRPFHLEDEEGRRGHSSRRCPAAREPSKMSSWVSCNRPNPNPNGPRVARTITMIWVIYLKHFPFMAVPACAVPVRDFDHRQAETGRREREQRTRPSGHVAVPSEPDEDCSRETAEEEEEARARAILASIQWSCFQYWR